MNQLRVSELWIYPIKSLGGISIPHANVLKKGLEFDRRMMLVDDAGNFLTQRKHPQLSQFDVSLQENTITITHQLNNKQHQFEFGTYQAESIYVSIWDDTVLVHEVSAYTSEWFTEQLKFSCRLVFFPEINERLVDSQYASENEHVSLADGYPILTIGQKSLDDLNSRLAIPVTMQRFRPNMVFTGGKPYDEDTWRNFSVGTNRFIGVKNCSRCVLITVDPQSGLKGKEPLQTLSTYRKRNGEVYFGQNVLAIDNGVIRVGDSITFGH